MLPQLLVLWRGLEGTTCTSVGPLDSAGPGSCGVAKELSDGEGALRFTLARSFQYMSWAALYADVCVIWRCSWKACNAGFCQSAGGWLAMATGPLRSGVVSKMPTLYKTILHVHRHLTAETPSDI